MNDSKWEKHLRADAKIYRSDLSHKCELPNFFLLFVFVVSVSLSRNMGSGGATDYIDKSLLVATPIYSQQHTDSIILDGLTGSPRFFKIK